MVTGVQTCGLPFYNDGKVDCAEIAKKMDGGGHAGAAGFTVEDINTR